MNDGRLIVCLFFFSGIEKVVMCALDYATPLRIQTSPAHSSSSTDTSSEIGSAFNSPTQGERYNVSHRCLMVHRLFDLQNMRLVGQTIRRYFISPNDLPLSE